MFFRKVHLPRTSYNNTQANSFDVICAYNRYSDKNYAIAEIFANCTLFCTTDYLYYKYQFRHILRYIIRVSPSSQKDGLGIKIAAPFQTNISAYFLQSIKLSFLLVLTTPFNVLESIHEDLLQVYEIKQRWE